jgi:hypothetical protein
VDRGKGSGSAGRWPAAFGSLPNARAFNSVVNINPCSRQAAANYRLAACAPPSETGALPGHPARLARDCAELFRQRLAFLSVADYECVVFAVR